MTAQSAPSSRRRRVGSRAVIRSFVAGATSLLLAAGALIASATTAPVAPAYAATTITCGPVYGLDWTTNPHRIWQVDTSTGALTDLALPIPATGLLNSLAVNAATNTFWLTSQNGASPVTVYRVNAGTGAITTFGPFATGLATASGAFNGAINPANGIFYYGMQSGSVGYVYGFDTTTNTYLGQIARITVPAGNNNISDFALDPEGRLYYSTDNTAGSSPRSLIVSDSAIPTTGSSTPPILPTTVVAVLPAGPSAGSLAFGADGLLYLASTNTDTMLRINPSSGAVLATLTLTPTSNTIADFASCASPSTISVQKDVGTGRFAPGDQFALSVSGGGLTAGNTGLTTGSEPGVQNQSAAEVAGPVVGTPGTTYTISESPSGTTVAGNYATSWQCVNTRAGNAVVASGTGTSGTFTMPTNGATGSAIVCTFLNDALIPRLAIDKTSSAGADAAVGQTVTYEVEVTNTGDGAFTTANPASFSDDLSDVLDDATYNNDAAVSFSAGSTGTPPTLSGSTLAWSGALQAGETATFTYSVTLTNAGDGSVVNTACVPAALSSESDNCASTTTELPRLTISKVADRTALPADGGTVTYTVTVTNEGPGDTTGANPAAFSDDLSEVLDDGTLDPASITSSTGAATASGTTLDWSGVLAVGESATVSYTVTYDSSTGNQQLVNGACLPVDLAQSPAERCRVVQIPGAGLSQSKSVNPASGSAVVPGQLVTYTLSFVNTGQTAVTVNSADDASDVLDDAAIISPPAAGQGTLVAGPIQPDGTFTITGSVPVGETSTIVYSVRVLPFASQSDSVLSNVLADSTGACAPGQCTTVNPVPHLSIDKDVLTDTASAGDVVTYSVTLTNDGEVDYAAGSPATFTDDLSGVLDDATYNGDVTATSGSAGVVDEQLTWSGPLAVGESVTVTYSVTVTSAGDTVLENTACTPAIGTDAAECADTTTNLSNVIPAKSSDPASGAAVQAGEVIVYTLSWTNDGTAAGVVDSTDDLTQVTDDAAVTTDPGTISPGVTVAFDGTILVVSGPIAAGATVTVTYEVTVRPDGDRGDNLLTNQLIPADADITPPPPVVHPVGELEDGKSSDPASGSTVRPGQVVTYTLTFANSGQADIPVDRDDVHSDVLDDADITTAPASSDPALTVTPVAAGRFNVAGTLSPGQTVTVTYEATVRPDGERGDDQLGNFLVDGGATPPTECLPVDGETPDCTVNPVSNVTVAKSSDPASGQQVQPGQQVTYTLTFANVSVNSAAAPSPLDFTDYLVDVVDDATLSAAPASSSGDVAGTIIGDTIRVTGTIPSSETVTVSYVITVKDYAAQGDHVIGNVVAVTGVAPICVTGSALCTEHVVPPPPPGAIPPGLARTGAELAGGVLLSALLLTGVGAGMVIAARRRRIDATRE